MVVEVSRHGMLKHVFDNFWRYQRHCRGSYIALQTAVEPGRCFTLLRLG